MSKFVTTALICLLSLATYAFAQDKPAITQEKPVATAPASANPYTDHSKKVYAGVKDLILRSAEKMPEENYAFKPTEAVRSYGQILGHVADAQYLFCSKVLGEANPGLNVEKTKTTKADLTAALKESFAYCDKAYNGITDVNGAQTVNFFGGEVPKLSLLGVNSMHTVEHYGNLITYMRLKNIVPPSSEPRPQQQKPPQQAEPKK